MLNRLFFILILSGLTTLCYSQRKNSLNSKQLSNDTNQTTTTHSPKKAAIMSAILPGLGQTYNKKYWKVPVIYAGFAGLGYLFGNAQKKYTSYRDAYIIRLDADTTTTDEFVGIFKTESLDLLQGRYHRLRDLTVVGMVALYFLNVIDASVDAHLFYFDVSDNLSLRIFPYMERSFQASNTVKGAGIVLTF